MLEIPDAKTGSHSALQWKTVNEKSGQKTRNQLTQNRRWYKPSVVFCFFDTKMLMYR
jgi:hypothetical protein